MKKLFVTVLLVFIMLSLPAFAASGSEDEASQISLIQTTCSTTEKQAKDIYAVLKAVGLTPVTKLGIYGLRNNGYDIYSDWHVNGNDFYASMTLFNSAVSTVRLDGPIYANGKVLATVSEVSIPHTSALQYKQAADKATEKALYNLYSNSNGYYTVKNFKPDSMHWYIVKKVSPEWKDAPKDCVYYGGSFYFELYYNGKVSKGDGNLCWGFLDKNLNAIDFRVKNIGLKN